MNKTKEIETLPFILILLILQLIFFAVNNLLSLNLPLWILHLPLLIIGLTTVIGFVVLMVFIISMNLK